MKVLQINKFYYPRGGSERYLFDVSAALVRAGHEVTHFSMHHEENLSDPNQRHFVPFVDFHAGGSPLDVVKRAARFVYSADARDRLAAMIEEVRPDVAHLHNIAHQLTPAIFEALRRAGVPIVQTLHDYKRICSSYLMFAGGSICERCRGGRHYEAALRRCHHGSLGKSVLGFVEMTFHSVRKSYDAVSVYLCPSRFLRDKHEAFGIDPGRLLHVPYFVDPESYTPRFEPGGYALYVGRLSREKGIPTLLRAQREVGRPLRVLGDGPLRDELASAVAETAADVELLGYRSGEALHETIRGASLVIVPSEWYENLPYAVLESFALGKPVIGARIGGIPELVRDGETGLLFDPGDERTLAAAWRRLDTDGGAVERMGRAARRRIEEELAPGPHVDRLTDVYRSVA